MEQGQPVVSGGDPGCCLCLTKAEGLTKGSPHALALRDSGSRMEYQSCVLCPSHPYREVHPERCPESHGTAVTLAKALPPGPHTSLLDPAMVSGEGLQEAQQPGQD